MCRICEDCVATRKSQNKTQQFSTVFNSLFFHILKRHFENFPDQHSIRHHTQKFLLLKRTAFINVEVKSINVFRTERRNAGQQFYNSSTMKNVYFNILKTVYATNAKKTICFENLHENNSENRANNRIKT